MKRGLLLFLLLSVSFLFAYDEELIGLYSAMNYLCVTIRSMLPIIAILLFAFAGLVYGVGQVFGASMRESAKNWATSMIIGAVVSLIIWVIARPLIAAFFPGGVPEAFCTTEYVP